MALNKYMATWQCQFTERLGELCWAVNNLISGNFCFFSLGTHLFLT